MKKYIILILAGLIILPAVTGARKIYGGKRHDRNKTTVRHVSGTHHIGHSTLFLNYDVDEERIFLYTKDEEDEIKINPDYAVSINGRTITLDQKQRDLVGAFYRQTLEVHKISVIMGEIGAKMGSIGGDMGRIGGKIGYLGGRVGYQASLRSRIDLSSANRHHSSDHDSDKSDEEMEKLEEEMEKIDEEIEALEEEISDYNAEISERSDEMETQNEVLQEYNEEMEAESEKLEEAFYDMTEAIPELDKLDWK